MDCNRKIAELKHLLEILNDILIYAIYQTDNTGKATIIKKDLNRFDD